MMKIRLLLILVLLLQTYAMVAQEAKQFIVKAGKVASEVIPFEEKYRYPQFREGNVAYNNGTSAAVLLNYNLLLGEMQLINPRGDTATLVNEPSLKIVRIGNAVFHNDYKEGYFEVIADYTAIKLAVSQQLQLIISENAADNGYGVSSGPTTAVASVRSPNTNQRSPVDIIFTKGISYGIIDQNNRVHQASKASIRQVFQKHKKAVNRYLKENQIDFNKEADLKKLLQFCSQLLLN